jgi:hypothetical protein
MKQHSEDVEMEKNNDMKNVTMEIIIELLIPIVRFDVISNDDQ